MTTKFSNGKAVTTKKIFSRETPGAVSIDIQAASSIIWALLTNATEPSSLEFICCFYRWEYCSK